ncbi:MAG: hypothetical protein F6K41_39110 [Symploca sp. SIO3E6]|nr:hypothetical protein [Caldora sp. SIO3E6]
MFCTYNADISLISFQRSAFSLSASGVSPRLVRLVRLLNLFPTPFFVHPVTVVKVQVRCKIELPSNYAYS